MLLPIEWLKDYVKIDRTDRELADALTLSGSHVESITDKSGISKVVTGKIAKLSPHKNADKLQVCQVDIGQEKPIQIVTGATNIREGDIVPVALDGAILAGGLKIKDSELRGEASQGMLCSFEELGYGESVIPKESRDGIMIFPGDAGLGVDVSQMFHLKAGIIEFEITPNRPDCLSIIGMARETAATFDEPLSLPKPKALPAQEIGVEIEVQSADCLRYYGCVVEDVVIEPSPLWMQLRLMAAGMRPINTIVDITNYVMLEYNQPLHAFDLDELDQESILVRNGRDGEKLMTLDKVERAVTSKDVMITDGEKLLGFAGIMGGLIGEVTEKTKRVFLESANFHEGAIRKTSKRLGLRTEASTRYEKGLDPNTCELAAWRFCQLVEEIGCGRVVKGHEDYYPNKRESVEVRMRAKRCNMLLGLNLSKEEMGDLLGRLGFEPRIEDDELIAKVPTYRADVTIEADLIEEVGRLYGFHRIPAKALYGELTTGGRTEAREKADLWKELMISMGFDEILTYSFISPKFMERMNLGETHPWRNVIKILNPLGEDFSVMRPTQIPNMLEVMNRNINRGNDKFRAFEIGHIFIPVGKTQEEEPIEERVLTWSSVHQDFYFMKEVVEKGMVATGVRDFKVAPEVDHPLYHPGRCASLWVGEELVGYLGEIHPLVLSNYGIKKPLVVGEMNLEKIFPLMSTDRTFVALPKYPGMSRDLAVVVDEDVLVAEIEQIAEICGGGLLESFKLFDVYEGDQIEVGKKSLAFTLSFRRPDRTLKDEEVQEVVAKIREMMESKLDASWRE